MSDLANDFVIGDGDPILIPTVDGKPFGRGLIERNYELYPVGYTGSGSVPFSIDDMPLIPMEEWPERIADMEANKSRLSDMYRKGNSGQKIPSLDQNGQGYCWAYSTAACIQALRCKANAPYVQLSAHSVACVIKNFRDQGGWGAASLEFAVARGYVPTSLWPAKSMSRSNDTEANWKAALEFRVTEGWVDLEPAAYDRYISAKQVGTCLMNRVPVIGDFNWWGHSVGVFDLVDVYSNKNATDIRRYGTRIMNSWTDNWGDLGFGVLKDSKAFPNGGAAPRASWGG